jgi:hypothetical protein
VSALHLLLQSLSHALFIQWPKEPHVHSLFLEMDDLIGILLSPHDNRMSGLLTDAYKIEAARSCICVEEGTDMVATRDNNFNNLPSYFNLLDEDLLGAAGMSDSEADPDILDTSSESLGSSRIASIESELASSAVSPTEVGAMQMKSDQHQQQAEVSRSGHQGIVADILGGASHNETAEGHVRTDSDGEDMAVSGLVLGELVSTTSQINTGAVFSNFGNDFEVVELVTDSSMASVAEVGGPDLGST